MLVEHIFRSIWIWSAARSHWMHAGLTEGEFSLYTTGVDTDRPREV